MTSEEVKAWVRSGKGLNRAPIVNIFDELEITGAELRDVTIDMLEMMELPRFFAKRLIAKIEALINSPEPMKSAAIVKVESTQEVVTVKLNMHFNSFVKKHYRRALSSKSTSNFIWCPYKQVHRKSVAHQRKSNPLT